MRAVAVGRRRWLFAVEAEGGQRAAGIHSVIGTCGLLGVVPGEDRRGVYRALTNEATAQRLGWRLVDPSEVPACERYWLSAEEQRAAEEAEGSLPPSGSVVRVGEGGAKAVRARADDRR